MFQAGSERTWKGLLTAAVVAIVLRWIAVYERPRIQRMFQAAYFRRQTLIGLRDIHVFEMNDVADILTGSIQIRFHSFNGRM
jgi:hypothetical protein